MALATEVDLKVTATVLQHFQHLHELYWCWLQCTSVFKFPLYKSLVYLEEFFRPVAIDGGDRG